MTTTQATLRRKQSPYSQKEAHQKNKINERELEEVHGDFKKSFEMI
jgi:hypothetical protein